MKTSEIIRITLVTALGNFFFAPHHNSEADFYEAMVNFESNNWKFLGSNVSYIVYRKFGDGEVTELTLSGTNASAVLSEIMDEERQKQS